MSSTDPRQTAVKIENLKKVFSKGSSSTTVLDDFNLEIKAGEFVSCFGPNGCGKSTLIHLIAGILKPDSGTITTDTGTGKDCSTGIVFQNYEQSLLPWRTCAQNIALPLERSGQLNRPEQKELIFHTLEHLGISLPLDSYPYQMSGGQKQLTCIARAVIAKPALLLLDEPFASLDYQTRINMQLTLLKIWEKTKITTLFISHEIDEAIFLCDRFLLLTKRPASIAHSYSVDIDRPRTLETISSQKFTDVRNEVLTNFISLGAV